MTTIRTLVIASTAFLALGGIASANPGWEAQNKPDPYSYSQTTPFYDAFSGGARADSCLVRKPIFDRHDHVAGDRTVDICK